MRKYPGEPKSLLADWLRVATPEMRTELCKRIPCPLNSLQSLAYGNRKMPRLDRGTRIVTCCNELRQEALDKMALSTEGTTSAVIPPLMTIKGLIDGVNRNDR